ncbi:sigma-70 family RNA polymerase sigma factor [Pelagicoccus albus]|uniref:RNA polymerase sigma factor n=1 Tax=Pelagicoccus albus TaxID=415222 RepID=A0A7X1B4D2_9BACT|nr:sigma-70 family RNA polymerase sigma factor [Pelagicoccus albus]MBC2605412.1 sigma-70 family RNA polymerase sigma factor [Pelagicoccus albus]
MSREALIRTTPNTDFASNTSALKIFNEDEPGATVRVNFRSADSAPSEKPEPTERNSIKTYLQEIGKIDLLTPTQEVILAHRIQDGDKTARDLMIKANLRLVVKIAHDYKDFGLPVLDLISEGNIGLIKAVERFDPEKGGKLSTYAAWWIKQSIKRALANQSKTIRLPVHLVDKISRMRKMSMALTEELGREPTDQELADMLEMPVNKVSHLKSVSVRPTSLNAPIGDDGNSTEFGEIVGDDNAQTPYENLHEKSLRGDLTEMIEGLEDREAEIIRLRFGLNGDSPLTLEEVGKLFCITRERVRQLQNIALSKMRKIMASKERQHSAEEIEQENREKKRMEVFREFYEATSGRQ